MVDAALRAAGHRSARYTSPHLVDLAERFVIDGRPVEREPLIEAVSAVLDAAGSLQRDGVLQAPATFFEATTATAFELFRRAKVEIAVLEVGLGGRLDATNVITPLVCAITSIAFDHEKYLGSTLREIAVEKAGIIKPGVPVVVGELEADALSAIEGIARQRGAEVIRTSPRDVGSLAVGLPGKASTRERGDCRQGAPDAQRARVPVDEAAIRSGVADPGWPGRLDRRRLADGREVLLDAAHNPAGAAALASYLQEQSMEGLPLVFGVMRDKDVDGMLRALAPAVGHIVLTRASTPRSADPVALAERVRAIAPELGWTIESSPAAALEAAGACRRGSWSPDRSFSSATS